MSDERQYPDMEIKRCMKQADGDGWLAWLSEDERYAIAALRWKAGQRDEIPGELEELRDAIAQFGHAPIEVAVARVQGLEKAFAEIEEILGYGAPSDSDNDQIREIVSSCVKYSGGFDQ